MPKYMSLTDTFTVLNKEYNMNKATFDHVTTFLEQNKTVQKGLS